MLERYFTHPRVLRRHRGRLLGPFLDSYVALAGDLGYPRQNVRHQCHVIGHFSDWLERHRLGVADIDGAVVERHMRSRKRTRHVELVTLRRFVELLRELGQIPPPASMPPLSASDALVSRFEKHLEGNRRVVASTARYYGSFAREFLAAQCPDGTSHLQRLRASDVTAFVVTWTRAHPRARAKLLVTALRAFLRFLLQHGDIDFDLAPAVPSVAGWRLAGLPKYLPRDQVERVLASCDRRTAKGRRSYAILLLLAKLGIRAREVARLEIGDIDWEAGELIVRGKSLREDRLPLVQDVGEALADYLRHGRPQCSTRRVFVTARAPIRAISEQSVVTTIVTRAMRRAGLDPRLSKPHALRHSLATRMLAGGASMAEIAEVLRHRSPQTTEIYAKVDFRSLRALALPWPGKEATQ